jgi:hypothetical protein
MRLAQSCTEANDGKVPLFSSSLSELLREKDSAAAARGGFRRCSFASGGRLEFGVDSPPEIQYVCQTIRSRCRP